MRRGLRYLGSVRGAVALNLLRGFVLLAAEQHRHGEFPRRKQYEYCVTEYREAATAHIPRAALHLPRRTGQRTPLPPYCFEA